MERAKEKARSRGEAEAKRILKEARQTADEVFAELTEMRKQQAKQQRMENTNEARAELRRKLNEAEEALRRQDGSQEPIPAPSRPIVVGDLVEIPGVRQNAEVISVNKDGTLLLKAGILKMTVKAAEVRLIEEPVKKPAAGRTASRSGDIALRAAAPRSWTSVVWKALRPRVWWRPSSPVRSWVIWIP